MKSLLSFSALLLGAVVAASGQEAPKGEATAPADPVVISVGTEQLTKSQFESFLSVLPPQVKAGFEGEGKRKFAEQLTDMMALAQEARRRKLDQTPEMKQRIAIQTDNLLASELYRALNSETRVDDGAAKAYYDMHKSEFEQAKASHILVRFAGSPVPVRKGSEDLTEEQALAKITKLREQIAGGADFAEIAKAESDDTGSGLNGGSLGEFGRGRMIAEFEQAAFSQPVGELSAPLKTKFGYHLIKVEGRSTESFDDVKPKIEAQLKPEMARKAIDDIKKTAQVTISEEYFGK